MGGFAELQLLSGDWVENPFNLQVGGQGDEESPDRDLFVKRLRAVTVAALGDQGQYLKDEIAIFYSRHFLKISWEIPCISIFTPIVVRWMVTPFESSSVGWETGAKVLIDQLAPFMHLGSQDAEEDNPAGLLAKELARAVGKATARGASWVCKRFRAEQNDGVVGIGHFYPQCGS